ncbi:MAG: carboxypeptidase-like regulatory domain-containing protein [Flavobacterium sp.]|nr:carboxypeptidase-like regulatory domain-containing protein [Flavobacterium sp.]
MIKLIFIFFCVFISFQVFSQSKLEGIVIDSFNNPVDRATIQIKKSDLLLKTVLSDKNGNFFYLSNTDTTQKIKLIVSHISFKKQELEIDTKEWKFSKLKIVLNLSKENSLQEVVVKALPINVNDDTTTYRLKAFTNGTEKTLEDVAKKLPGMIVNDDGSLSFKGKRLTKILIEGEDLLSNKTKLLTKNFPADLLDNIQVIENYNDNKILKGFNQGDQTVMNLKLNKRKLKVAFGELSLSVGIPKRHDYNAIIFSLLNKTKSATIANYNNIGKDNIQVASLNIDSDDALQKISNFNFHNIVNLPENIISPYLSSLPLPSQRWFFNNQINFNNQTNFNLSKKIKTKLSTSFQNDDVKLNFNRQSNYFQQALNFNITDTISNQFKPIKLKVNLQNDFDISNNSQLRLIMQFDLNKNNFFNTQLNNQLNVNSINIGQLKNNLQSYFMLMDYAKILNQNNIVLINSYFSFKVLNQNYKVISDNFGLSLLGINDYNPINQKNYSQNSLIGTQFQMLNKKNNYVSSTYFDIQGNFTERNNLLTLESNTSNDSIFKASEQSDKNIVITTKIGYKGTYKHNGMKFINSLEIGYINWDNNLELIKNRKIGFIGNLELNLSQRISKYVSVSIIASAKRIYNNNHMLNDSFMLISNNELMRYTSINLLNDQYNLGLNLFLINRKLLFISLNSGFSYQPQGFIASNNLSNSLNFIQNKFESLSNSSKFITLQSKSPILKLKSRIELSSSVLSQSLPFYEKENLYSRFKSVTTTIELKYLTVFKTKLNGEVGTKFINSNSSRYLNSTVLNNFTNISLIYFTKVFYKYKNTSNISIFYSNYNLNINNEPLRLNFIDFEISYSIPKSNCQLEILAKNLLNQRNYNQFNISPQFQNNTSYLLFGRSIDLSVKFKL